MAHSLAPAERLAYERLRLLTEAIIARCPQISQRLLADAVGVAQPTVSTVLKARTASVVTLQAIGRALLPMVSANDQRRLLDELALVGAIVRKPHTTPPTAR
jgi:hypothetical protein